MTPVKGIILNKKRIKLTLLEQLSQHTSSLLSLQFHFVFDYSYLHSKASILYIFLTTLPWSWLNLFSTILSHQTIRITHCKGSRSFSRSIRAIVVIKVCQQVLTHFFLVVVEILDVFFIFGFSLDYRLVHNHITLTHAWIESLHIFEVSKLTTENGKVVSEHLPVEFFTNKLFSLILLILFLSSVVKVTVE